MMSTSAQVVEALWQPVQQASLLHGAESLLSPFVPLIRSSPHVHSGYEYDAQQQRVIQMYGMKAVRWEDTENKKKRHTQVHGAVGTPRAALISQIRNGRRGPCSGGSGDVAWVYAPQRRAPPTPDKSAAPWLYGRKYWPG